MTLRFNFFISTVEFSISLGNQHPETVHLRVPPKFVLKVIYQSELLAKSSCNVQLFDT